MQFPTSPKLSVVEIMKNIIDEMEKGKVSVQMIRSISLQRSRLKVKDCDKVDDVDETCKALNQHAMVALTSYTNSIAMLKNCDLQQEFMKKRKIQHSDDNNDGECNKFQGTLMDVTKDSASGRGRYKRRSGEARVEEVSHLSDDGFGWRKYGQKNILNARHPRNYYRCTHKHDQNCQANKQVQQISESPSKYIIIYHGNHTCENIFKSNPTVDTQQHHSSTILLSFDHSTQINPMLFPTPNFPQLKQEHKSINEETMPSISHDSSCVQNHHSSPSFDSVSVSQDVTATTGLSSTPVSEQSDMISTAENCSEYFSHVWDGLETFQDLYDPY